MKRVIGNILCDPVPRVKVKGQIMYFFVNASPLKPLDIPTLQVKRSQNCHDAESTEQHQSQIMFFLVNASPP